MVLSTAIPIDIAAIVIVIMSKGIFKIPINPKMNDDAIIFGIIAAMLNLTDLKRIINIINIASRINPKDFT